MAASQRLFLRALSGWQYFAWTISSIALFLTFLWFFGIVGMLYLLDYLTLGIQARHSYDVAVLRVTEASFGRFRHTLKVIVEKDFLSEKEELQLKAPFPKMHNTLLTDRYIRGLRTKDLVSHKTLRGLVLLLMAAFVYMPIQVTHAASPTSSLDGLGVPIGPDSQALTTASGHDVIVVLAYGGSGLYVNDSAGLSFTQMFSSWTSPSGRG